MKRLLFVFLDGVGLGDEGSHNPFTVAATPCLDALLGGRLSRELEAVTRQNVVFRQLEAGLGVPGLPQSATGQAALLTGHNAAALMGRHYGPFPGPTLRTLLRAGTLFSEVRAAGGRGTLANVYPPAFFARIGEGQRLNVPVFSALAAGLELRGNDDYAAGEGASADLTGSFLHALDPGLPERRPEEAGRLLAELARAHHFTFFDFWLSDVAGHRWSVADASALVARLDAFFTGLVPALGGATLVVTSDHGNLEDKRSKSHSRNPVPLLILGETTAFASATSLLDVAPAVRRTLGLKS